MRLCDDDSAFHLRVTLSSPVKLAEWNLILSYRLRCSNIRKEMFLKSHSLESYFFSSRSILRVVSANDKRASEVK